MALGNTPHKSPKLSNHVNKDLAKKKKTTNHPTPLGYMESHASKVNKLERL